MPTSSAERAPCLIRAVEPADRAEWLPLWEGYNAFYGRSGQSALPAEVTQASWDRFHDPDEPVWALVARSQGRLVGLAHYLFHRSTTSLGPACYLQDLFTAATERGRGIATALITAVGERARAAGSLSLYWQTHSGNEPAIRVYDRLAARSEFVIYRAALS